MTGRDRKPLLRVLGGERTERPPLWMMRQAGRYLPEYRAVRADAGSFLDLCYNPERACEVTLQPIRRFGFDAAIIFSDILIIPHALGVDLTFAEGEGPRLSPIGNQAGLDGLRETLDPGCTEPVYEAIRQVSAALPDPVTLIGFVGAPWTVATYMVAGRGTPDHIDARIWALRDPVGFGRLIDILIDASIEHLCGQIRAGAEVVQIFDSWAGELSAPEFDRWCVTPVRAIVDGVRARHRDIPVIAFPRAAGSKLRDFGERFGDVTIGLDTGEAPGGVAELLAPGIPVQGNLDPITLIAGGEALDRSVDMILEGFSDRPHIFNLGHGIRPQTPIDHVERLVRRVKG